MRIKINGKEEILDKSISLQQLLARKGLDKKRVVIELDLKIIPEQDLANTLIQEDDSIEIINFVGGG